MKKDSGYNTRQKEIILDYLVKNKDKHTNVQEISAYLLSGGSSVGTATIYRQLDKLVESGIVRKYNFDGKTGACYQYIDEHEHCNEHFHLKCTVCGKLIHLECDHLSGVNEHIKNHHGFTVDPSQTVFYGICAECAGNK